MPVLNGGMGVLVCAKATVSRQIAALPRPALSHDQGALGLLVEIVEELVAARLPRSHVDDTLGIAIDDSLDPQSIAFEFDRLRIEVLDAQGDRRVCRGADFGR